MNLLQENLNKKVTQLCFQTKMPSKIAIAISGGADSVALCFLLQEYCREAKIELLAVTVDHKIRENSSSEALNVGALLNKHGISHHILELTNKVPEKNIEASLREKRYSLLYDFCLAHEIEFLFLGHQEGDVAENFLIRLFRGSGLDGLSAIAEISDLKKIKLVRPLLDVKKDDLKEFLKQKNIAFFEDETNKDEKFLRNKIRNFLESLPENDLIQKRIKKSADEISKIRDHFDSDLLREARYLLRFDKNGTCYIERNKFSEIDETMALKILALVLMEVGGKTYKPRFEKLKNFYHYLASEDIIKPRNFYGCLARLHEDKYLKIEREKAAIDLNRIEKIDNAAFLIDGRLLIKDLETLPDSIKNAKFHFRTILKNL